jgi:TolB-like protein
VRTIAAFLVFGVFTAGWAQQPPAESPRVLIAILPVENMTGRTFDGAPIEAAFRDALAARGVSLLEPGGVRAIMDAHRVRYTGGVAADLAGYFRDEAAVTGVLVTSVERWDETETPALALTSRLVSTEALPHILWVDSRGATGEDRPGFLDLGVVTEPGVILTRTVAQLADSLTASLSGDSVKRSSPQRRFRPRKASRHPDGVLVATPLSIAVLPFTNRTPRRHAGDLVALHFVQQLALRDEVKVVEPGVVRDILLRMRLIPEGGIPFSQVELLKELLGADLVLTGDVLDYIDTLSADQAPVVDFMTQLLDADRRTVVWSSFNHNSGADRVWFFDAGRLRTAGALGTAMAQATVDRMLRESPSTASKPPGAQ